MVVKQVLEKIVTDNSIRKDLLKAWKAVKLSAAGVVAGLTLYSSVYSVPANSIGVVQRFGAYAREANPGLHVKLPWIPFIGSIESVEKVPIKEVQTEEFGFRSQKGNFIGPDNVGQFSYDELEEKIRSSGLEPSGDKNQWQSKLSDIMRSEYLMLTGDLNMADVEWIVQYNIKDAKAYLFSIRSPKTTLRDCSLSVMKDLTGNRSADEVISIGREEYAMQSKIMLQKLLDECDSGINVVTVRLQSSQAPQAVRDSFNRVSKAMNEKETKINQAMQEYNKQVPRAKGESQKMIEDAYGYSAEIINRAKGDTFKFNKKREAYASSPDITMERMYFDALGKYLHQAKEVTVIEQKGADGGVLLKLNVDGDNK